MKKNILTVAILFGFSMAGFGQTKLIDDLVEITDPKNVTYINIAKPMLDKIFEDVTNKSFKVTGLKDENITEENVNNLKIPEAYCSVTVKTKDNLTYINFQAELLTLDYNVYLEKKEGGNKMTSYYQKSLDNNINEIYILNFEGNSFSAFYIRGEIDATHINSYLLLIRTFILQGYNDKF